MSDGEQRAREASEVAPADNGGDVASRGLRFRPRHLQYAIPYSIAVSVIYLWGYWGTFQVDPLEYVGIGDVVKLSVYPLSVALVTGAALIGVLRAGIGVFEHLSAALDRMANSLLPENPNLANSIANLSWLGIIAVLFFVWLYSEGHVAAEAIARKSGAADWDVALFFGLILSVSVAIKAAANQEFAAIFDSRLLAMLAVFLVLAPIVCAFPAGRFFAQARLGDGCVPVEIDVQRSSAIPALASRGTYLGNLGGHVFVRERKTGAVIVTRFAEGQSLVLLPLDTRTDGQTTCGESPQGNATATPVEGSPLSSDKVD